MTRFRSGNKKNGRNQITAWSYLTYQSAKTKKVAKLISKKTFTSLLKQ